MKLDILSTAPLCLDWLVIVRIFIGILIMKHGFMLFDVEAMKKSAGFFASIHIPLPLFMAYVAKSAEFFGGLLLVLGLFTPCVSGVLAINMIVALGTAHHFNIFKDGGELAFLYLLLFIVFLLVGGGQWSLDNLFFRK